MKRPIFIIIGAVTIFILLAIWLYVLFFGSPQNAPENFTDLNFDDTTDQTYSPDNSSPEAEQEPMVDVTSPERLKQLTTKPTIGFQEVQKTASSSPAIYYIEAGTGHIFSIDLTTGEERRVSATTIPMSRTGALTPDGQYAMIQSGAGANKGKVFVGALSSTSASMSASPLTEDIVDFAATTDNTFLVAIQTSTGIIGKEYLPQEESFTTLFTVPFREATIRWGETASAIHLVYPKASSELEGFLYEVREGKLIRTPIDGFGLSAVGNTEGVVYSEKIEGEYGSFLYTKEGGSISSVVTFLPEKCTPLHQAPTQFICGGSILALDHNSPDSWYMGITTYEDNLWEIDTVFGNATLLSNTTKESGRHIDIQRIQANEQDERVYFINTLDRSLWLYNLSTSPITSEG